MQDSVTSKEHRNRDFVPIAEIDVLWITAGLGCDGDTIDFLALSVAESRTATTV
jgi:hypothetical protein